MLGRLGVPAADVPPHALCLARAAQRTGRPASELLAIVWHESRLLGAVSRTSDFGPAQIHCPGPWCRAAVPTGWELAELMDPCTSYVRAGQIVNRGGLGAYNPGSPEHAGRVRALAQRLERAGRKR